VTLVPLDSISLSNSQEQDYFADYGRCQGDTAAHQVSLSRADSRILFDEYSNGLHAFELRRAWPHLAMFWATDVLDRHKTIDDRRKIATRK
jgi:hypothetical protein